MDSSVDTTYIENGNAKLNNIRTSDPDHRVNGRQLVLADAEIVNGDNGGNSLSENLLLCLEQIPLTEGTLVAIRPSGQGWNTSGSMQLASALTLFGARQKEHNNSNVATAYQELNGVCRLAYPAKDNGKIGDEVSIPASVWTVEAAAMQASAAAAEDRDLVHA